MPLNEADTCREYVTPKLKAAGWDSSPHSLTEQKTFTDGRIFASGGAVSRGPQKRADYILRYTRDFAIAVVEAKPEGTPVGAGLQQAKEYAEMLASTEMVEIVGERRAGATGDCSGAGASRL